LPKVEHRNFEGHVMVNKDEYQKSGWLNLDIVLEYHNSQLSLLVTDI